jgi:Zn-finger nucleic acid-binding protein
MKFRFNSKNVFGEIFLSWRCLLNFSPAYIKITDVDKLIEIECPVCHANLWVDAEKNNVLQHKKSAKKNLTSFEDLLNKEKQKKEAVDERFSQAKSLEQAKKKKAAEFFEQNLKEK